MGDDSVHMGDDSVHMGDDSIDMGDDSIDVGADGFDMGDIVTLHPRPDQDAAHVAVEGVVRQVEVGAAAAGLGAGAYSRPLFGSTQSLPVGSGCM